MLAGGVGLDVDIFDYIKLLDITGYVKQIPAKNAARS
jgi:hypothetical protein